MNLLEKITQGFASIMAALADLKASMSATKPLDATALTEITELKATVMRQEQEIAGLKSEKAELEGKLQTQTDALAAANKTIGERDAEITTLKAEAKTAAERAQEMLAAQGISPTQLPAGGEAFGEGEVGAIRKQLASETDPAKKFQLAMKIRELSTKKNA